MNRFSRAQAALGRAGTGATGWVARHSVDLPRPSLDAAFLGFGVLKLVPGPTRASPWPGSASPVPGGTSSSGLARWQRRSSHTPVPSPSKEATAPGWALSCRAPTE